MASTFEVTNGVQYLRIEQRFSEQMEAETSSTIVRSFVHNRLEEGKVHMSAASLPGTVSASEIAGRRRLEEEMAGEAIVDPRLRPKLVERRRETFKPGRGGRDIHVESRP